MKSDEATILVVDDVLDNRQILARRLLRQGHTVLEAENGREALSALDNEQIDLVLLDIQMPEVDGFTVLEEMRASGRLVEVPVLVISAVDDRDSIVKCIELGATDHLPKPFEKAILNARVNACLERKRLYDAERNLLDQLKKEKKRSDELLLNILPASIAHRLKEGEREIAEILPSVTVLFSDLVGFKKLSATQTPLETTSLLGAMFTEFDELATRFGIEKIKTIGDAYMAVSGLPSEQESRTDMHAENAVRMAIEMANSPIFANTSIDLRVGLHSGPVAAGVIGQSKFCYDVWGETVNIAYVMEESGAPGRVHITQETAALISSNYHLINAQPLHDPKVYNSETFYVETKAQ